MKRISIVVMLAVLTVALGLGCATKGRTTLADLDFRDADQIKAGQFESAIPYANPTNETVQIKAEALPVDVWTQIMDALKVIKCRVRILTIEWNDAGGR